MLVAFTLLALAAHPALGAPLEWELREALIEEALAGDGPEAVAALIELAELREWSPPASNLAMYEQLSEGARSGFVRELAAFEQMRLYLESGDTGRAHGMERALGFVTDWNLIGPFPGEGVSGLDVAYPPETDGLFEESVPGKVGDVRWRPLSGGTESGYLAVSEFARPSDGSITYVAATCDARASVSATVDLAVDGPYRAWMNGVPVAASDNHLGGAFSRDRVDVSLQRGPNVLVVKIADTDGASGLHARIMTSDGRPAVRDCKPADVWVSLSAPELWPVPERPYDRVQRMLGTEPDSERLAAAAAVVAYLQPDDPSRPWSAWVDAALDGDPSPRALARLARAVEAEWRAEALLRTAAETGSAPHRLQWAYAASRTLGHRQWEDAVNTLRALAGEPELSFSAAIGVAQAMHQLGFDLGALAVVLDVCERSDWAPAAMDALEAIAGQARRSDIVARVVEQRLERDRTAIGLYDDVVARLRAGGRVSEADAWIATLEEVAPHRPVALLQRAWIARAEPDIDSAIELVTRALELAPGDADLWATRADWYLETGMQDEAAADLERALALRPQDVQRRELLESIRPQEDPFHERYRLSDVEILDLRTADTGRAAYGYTTLVDQRVTRVYDNGLASRWRQVAHQVHTRAGADTVRWLDVHYTPDAQMVRVTGARVIRASGNVHETFDASDQPPPAGPSSIYYDVHTRSVRLSDVNPGDVVVFEYVVSDIAYQNLFDDYFGELYFAQSDVPVRLARYVLRIPRSREIQRSETRLGQWTTLEPEEGERVMVYEARDVPAPPPEPARPGATEVAEHIVVSTYTSWDALADWYWHLIEDQLEPSAEILRTVENLVAGLTDDEEKVRAIHEYVVRNIRYVGLEFGIHGYKPYRVSDVFSRRFGDCKDTASLIKVMLQAAGIDARIVLIRTRNLGRIDAHPPSLAVFNHAITYVPSLDLFLDGTAGFSSAFELPTADQGASVLVVNEGRGGEFGTSPVLPAERSVDALEIDVDLRGDVATGRVERRLTGAFAASARVANESDLGRAERFERELSGVAPGIVVGHVEVDGADTLGDAVLISADTRGGQWIRGEGAATSLLLAAGWESFTARYAGAEQRELPVSIPHAMTRSAVVRFRLPHGLTASSVPDAQRFETRFGSFGIDSGLDGQTVETRVELVIDVARVEPEDYPDFRRFLQDVDRALDTVALLVEVP